jgi:hypothetical protein
MSQNAGRGGRGGRGRGRGGRGSSRPRSGSRDLKDPNLNTIFVQPSSVEARDDRRKKMRVIRPSERSNAAAAGASTSVGAGSKGEEEKDIDIPSNLLSQHVLNLWPEMLWKDKFPDRPGEQICMHFIRTNDCDFPNCRFDHPAKGKGCDEALVDAVILSGDTELSDLYTLVFAVIRSVISYQTKKTRNRQGYGDDIMKLCMNSILKQCVNIVNREWDNEIVISTYGYENIMFQNILPRAIHSYAYYATNSCPENDIDYHYLNDVQKQYVMLRLTYTAREDKVANHLWDIIPRLHIESDYNSTGENNIVNLHKSLINNCRESVAVMSDAAAERDEVKNELSDIIQKYLYEQIVENYNLLNISNIKTNPDRALYVNDLKVHVTLHAFGSSANTIGTKQSDLDLSLDVKITGRVSDNLIKLMNSIWCGDPKKILTNSMHALGLLSDDDDDDDDDEGDDDDDRIVSSKGASKVSGNAFELRENVLTARVPVLKLKHVATGIDIDLIDHTSNSLALLNTQLIRDYASSDVRIRPLMYAIKRWANARCVSDSRNGTLSTYCWMILIIHFLQFQGAIARKDDSDDEDNEGTLVLTNLQDDANGTKDYFQRPSPSLQEIYSQIPIIQGGIATTKPTSKSASTSVVSSSSTKQGTKLSESEMSGIMNQLELISSVKTLDDNAKKELLKELVKRAEKEKKLLLNVMNDHDLKDDADNEDDNNNHNKIEANQNEFGMVRLFMNFFVYFGTYSQDLSLKIFEETPSIRTGQNFPKGVNYIVDFEKIQLDNETMVFDKKRILNLYKKDLGLGGCNHPGEKYRKVNLAYESDCLWRIVVEDPFELDHDLGSVIRTQIGQAHILNECRRAMFILFKNLDDENLLTSSLELELGLENLSVKESGSDNGTRQMYNYAGVDHNSTMETLPDTWEDSISTNTNININIKKSLSEVFEELCEVNSKPPNCEGACFVCQSVEHSVADCRRFICFKCEEHGHFPRNCTGKRKKGRHSKKDDGGGGNRRRDRTSRRDQKGK